MTDYTAAPVFTDNDANADSLGFAAAASEAEALYYEFFFNDGIRCIRAEKATFDIRGEGLVDGWVPVKEN